MERKIWIGVLVVVAVLVALTVPRAGASARTQADLSMLVGGALSVDAQGTVTDWKIDRRDMVPPDVVALVERSARTWRFEPALVDGRPAAVEARMSLRIVATKLTDSQFRIAIHSGHFSRPGRHDGDANRAAAKDGSRAGGTLPPPYPAAAARAGAQGVVYLLLRVDPSGKVEDAAAEQVNLLTGGGETQGGTLRQMFAKPSVAAAKKWRFPPSTTDDPSGSPRIMRMSVEFTLPGSPGPASPTEQYGKWRAYLPGPRYKVPWAGEDEAAEPAVDTLMLGEIRQSGNALTLLTPLEG